MAADVVTAAEPPIGGFRYLFKSTGGSSDKYGPCEVCGERVSEVFHQAEEKRCAAKHADDGAFWTQHACNSLFGHAACLEGSRHQPVFSVTERWPQ